MFGPQNNGNSDPDGPKPPQFKIPNWVWPAVWVLILLWLFFRVPGMVSDFGTDQPVEVPYSFFVEQVEANNVVQVTFQETALRGRFRNTITWPPASSSAARTTPAQTSNQFTTTLLPVDDPDLTRLLRENNVTVIAQTNEPSPILIFLLNFGPILLLLGFFVWSARRAQGQMGGVFSFGRSQAREYNAERPQVTFADVAGQDNAKQELEEIVDFLKEPDKYVALGARIPRGVLLIGPPGTGKTLMARAVAGEANVAFFSLAASEFVEMFVGVGASRVRDLFNRAKDSSPSIIFIDEIDAVGRRRGAGLGGGHDEREQTLNQMLAEMDGFDQNESVIVMAATNRADVLDPALLRPGRFDRQVTVGAPDRKGREAILNIHTKGKPLADDVELNEVARATIGFSGADLANLANEAALNAARASRKKIAMLDFTDAFERIVLGIKSPPLANEQERRLTAYHEAGHALVAALTPNADPVFKVTIVPRGQALGITAYMPEDDRRSLSKGQLLAHIHVGLGGRAAEQLVLGEVSTGAMGDIRQITNTARRMITQFGMSDELGLVDLSHEDEQPFLGYSIQRSVPYSDETLGKIDAEIKRIISDAYDHVLHLLSENRDKLDALAEELLNNEIVERPRVMEIAGVAIKDDREAEQTLLEDLAEKPVQEPDLPEQASQSDNHVDGHGAEVKDEEAEWQDPPTQS